MLFLDGPNRKLIYPHGVKLLRDRLRGDSFDLVHAHHGYVGAVALTQRRVPTVLTLHGSDLLGALDIAGKLSWGARLSAMGVARVAAFADEVIVLTRQMANRLRRGSHVIPHEVDVSLFAPVDRGEARRTLIDAAGFDDCRSGQDIVGP